MRGCTAVNNYVVPALCGVVPLLAIVWSPAGWGNLFCLPVLLFATDKGFADLDRP